VVFGFRFKGGKIVEVELLADLDRLGQLELAIFDG
jgi:hypothetical protein